MRLRFTHHMLFVFAVFSSIVSVSGYDGYLALDSWTNADTVIDIQISTDGTYLWSATHGGLVQWNLLNHTFEKHTTIDGLHDNWHLSATRDSHDTFYFGSQSSGIAYPDNHQWDYWTAQTDNLPYNEILALDTDPFDRLWASFGAAFGNGLGIRANGEWTFLSTSDGLSHNKIHAISSDENGAWIGTVNGLNRVTGLSVTEIYDTQNGLPENFITAIAHNNETVWVGTRMGLANITDNLITVFTIDDGLPGNLIQCLHLDHIGALHVGTDAGAAVFDSGTFNEIDVLDNLDIRTIRSGNNDYIYYGVYGKGIYVLENNVLETVYSTGDPLPGSDVRAVAFHNGKTWFGTDGMGVGWYNGYEWWVDTSDEGAGTAQVRHIVIDHDDTVWFSTFDKGVYSFHNGHWTRYHKDYGLPVNSVFSGFVDNDNTKWFATWGGGIAIYDNSTWSVIDESDGLPINITYAVEQDSHGVFWFAMDEGIISWYDGQFLDHYNQSDGLVYHRVYDITAQASDDSLWIGACRGLSHFKDHHFKNYFPGPDQLNHYRIRNILIDQTDSIWIATGHGINIFDDGIFHSITSLDGLAGHEVYSLAFDNNGNILVGARGGVSHIIVNEPESPPTGTTITMPSTLFFPGDLCRVDIELTNASNDPIESVPVYVLLDIYGEYFFGPSFTDEPDSYLIEILEPGTLSIEIIPDFIWPSDCGVADSVRWLAAMTTTDRQHILGEIGELEFGWSE